MTAFMVGFLKGGFGGGVGLSLTPLLSVLFPPKAVLGLIAPMLTLGDISIIKYYWGKWEKQHFKLLLPSMIIGILLGSTILSWVSEGYLRKIIGLFTLVFVIYQGGSILKEDVQLKVTPSVLKGLLGGAFSGVSSAIVHSGGVVVVIYLAGFGVAKEGIVATSFALFSITNLFKLSSYYHFGILEWSLLKVALLSFPAVFLGGYAGYQVNKNMPTRIFNLILLTIGLIAGLKLILF